MSVTYPPFSADGQEVRWTTWDGEHDEVATLRWENEGWTISGVVSRERIQYAIRATATWRVSQLLLFRDMEEPDLWLATDGSGRWGEMNGAHRPDLDGCYDIHLACTPLTTILPIRRILLHEGDTAELPIVTIDPETLEVRPGRHRYTRVASHRWIVTHPGSEPVEFEVDEHGLALDLPEQFRRVPPPVDGVER